MKSQQSLTLLLLISLLFLPLFATSARLDSGWTPIKNVNDPHVKELGEFAVFEYNNESRGALKFESVISGETQVVSGTNYKLIVAAKDGEVTNNYEAVVLEKPKDNFKTLTSFRIVK